MNQALQIALFKRILSLHSSRSPLKDFHFGETILLLQSKATQTSVSEKVSSKPKNVKNRLVDTVFTGKKTRGEGEPTTQYPRLLTPF